MSWIDTVVEQHKEFESPLNFWRWAAIASISAVVKDNVYLSQHMFNMYANIYVMFHADSGMKKGPPVNLAKRLVSKVGNTRVISGRSSIQGILKEMSQGESKPGQPVSKKAVAFICSSELSSSIVEDKVATTILTDLYDRNYNADQWKSLLKMESFDLKDPTISMLTATNESHSSDFFTRKDVSGGYFARTFIIHEREENRVNSLLVAPEVLPDYDGLAAYLKELAQLNGPFMALGSREESDYHKVKIKNAYKDIDYFYTPAGALYENWYREFASARKNIKDGTGTLNRFGSSVLKVAMLLSLAEKPDLIISEEAMRTAINMCEQLVGNVRKVTIGRDSTEGTNAERKILLLNELFYAPEHKLTRADLHRKFWMQGTVAEWDDCIKSLVEAEIMNIGQEGNHVVFQMTKEYVTKLTRFYEGKAK
jgi:hypothetical protein